MLQDNETTGTTTAAAAAAAAAAKIDNIPGRILSTRLRAPGEGVFFQLSRHTGAALRGPLACPASYNKCIIRVRRVFGPEGASMKVTRSILAAACAGVVGIVLATAADAQNLNQVLTQGERRIQLAQESQERVSNTVNQTRSLSEQYRQVLREIEGLEVYNTLLERQVARQERQKEQVRESIDQVTVVQRQIVPLMDRMIAGLEQFVALDVPFLEAERTNRVESLRATLERADVTVAEKFRRVMEAYQIENEYGRTIENYKGSLEVDGLVREVDFLRIGRVTLVYQTTDGQSQGVWDQSAGQWVALGSEYRNRIRQGLRVARRQLAPELLLMPIPAPEDL
jgi:TolA-binding protein